MPWVLCGAGFLLFGSIRSLKSRDGPDGYSPVVPVNQVRGNVQVVGMAGVLQSLLELTTGALLMRWPGR